MIALLLLLCSTAAADALGYPDDCTPGSRGEHWGHGGSYCAPHRCTSDADCAPRFPGEQAGTCAEASLCIVDEEVASYGGGPRRSDQPTAPPVPRPRERVTGPCGGLQMCSEGSCEAGRYCLPPTIAAARESAGCGCSAATRAGAGTTLGAALVIAALQLRRRRRTR